MGFDLWKRLKTITEFEAHAKCCKIPPSYKPRKGKGMVLSKKEGASLLFFEKGKWIEIPSKQQIAFTNVFRWTKDPKGEIHLEHLRFGMQKPFSLFTLTPVGKNHYRSLNPYECKEDIYVAHVLFDDHYVHLQWKISGPKKKENFTIAYF